jgi:cell wall-associated NlpC family hydrolase
LIINPNSGQQHYFEPSGYVAPLIGRPFCFGSLDCYGLVRDWYKSERSVMLPNFERRDRFWLRGENLFLDNFERAGFVSVALTDAKEGDVILQQIASPIPNHCGVLLGDGTLLHHSQGRLSSRDVYGGYWRKVTTHCLRYRGPL